MNRRIRPARATGKCSQLRGFAASLLVFVLSSSNGMAAAKEDGKAPSDPEATFYASSIGRSADDFLFVHYWSKGPLFRSETTINGHPVITIVNGVSYYILDPSLGLGIEIQRSPAAIAQDAKRSRPFGREYEEIIASGGEWVRSEKLDGRDVDVYKATNDQGRRTLWLARSELRLPLRIENFDRKSGRTGRLDYVIWIPGVHIIDEFFTPSPAIPLKRFESYGEYMQELRRGPIPPAPPLFRSFLRETD